MPKSLLLKQITSTYNDLLNQNKDKKNIPPLLPFVYDMLMHKYGIKKIGQEKFYSLLGTTLRLASDNMRIRIFG